MLFFKALKTDKLADPEFKDFYRRECHICALTLKVIEAMEASGEKSRILSSLDIDPEAYASLKEGDHCRPEEVMRLCRHLGIKTEKTKTCRRLTQAGPSEKA